MNDFTGFLRSLGIIPKAVLDDGRWRRGGTDSHPKSTNGAWKLLPGGRLGFGQDWAAHDAPIMWRAGKDAALPALDLDVLRRAQREHEAATARAIRAAREFYEACPPLRGSHAYLESHGLDMTGCFGLRVDRDGWLVVPAYRGDIVQTVQRISPEGEKRFHPGAPVSGTRYTVKRRNPAVTVLCEGLATGLACSSALSSAGYPAVAVVTWNAGNLARHEVRPSGFVVVAADNDHETFACIGKNPGVEAAGKAAERLGCGVAAPQGIRGTDWADWRSERLLGALERAGRWKSPGAVARDVDAAMARALMKHAVFLAAPAQ